MKPLTVGKLREIMKDLPDDAGVFPNWLEEPSLQGSISIEGFVIGKADNGKPCLLIEIEEHLWEDDEDDIEDSDIDPSVIQPDEIRRDGIMSDDNLWKD